jgi:uncharacterized protein (DUF2384 family)
MHQSPTTSRALLTKAFLRATEHLGLAAELPQLLRMTADEVESLRSGERTLDPHAEAWTTATKIVGLFRTLVSLLGTTEHARTWLAGPNHALDARPIDLLRTSDAERVYRYLDAVLKNELRLPRTSSKDDAGSH